MKKIILIALTVFIVSCSNSTEEQIVTPFEPVAIVPILISKKILNTGEGVQQQTTIITNENDWTSFKNQIDNYYAQFGINFTQQFFTETTIDFNNFIGIAVIDQGYANGGHSIDITNITEFETNIVVTVEKLQTGNQYSVATQPYHIVKIPITTKPIVFNML